MLTDNQNNSSQIVIKRLKELASKAKTECERKEIIERIKALEKQKEILK